MTWNRGRMKMIDNREYVEWTIDELEKLADEERRRKARSYYPSEMRIMGVKVPDQRNVMKRLKTKLKGMGDDEIIEVCKALVDTNIFECQQVAYDIIGKNRKLVAYLEMEDIEDLGKGLDNWVSVDTFSATIAGPAWRDGQIPHEIIAGWARSDDRWRRRSALVCTIALNQKARGGTGDTGRTLEICHLLADDHDDMVAKGMSWALRELSKIDRKSVEDFIRDHDDLAPRVKREVKRKLDTGRK
jgi:3-methyladenine DNA glycosylase AlkD